MKLARQPCANCRVNVAWRGTNRGLCNKCFARGDVRCRFPTSGPAAPCGSCLRMVRRRYGRWHWCESCFINAKVA